MDTIACPTCHQTVHRHTVFTPAERAILAELIVVLRALFDADDRAHCRRRTVPTGITP